MNSIFDYIFENATNKYEQNKTYINLTEHLKEYPDYPIAVKLSALNTVLPIMHFKDLYK